MSATRQNQNPNPDNSSLIQYMTELCREVAVSPDPDVKSITPELQEILEVLKHNTKLCQAVDDKLNQSRYPDSSIAFTRLPTINRSGAWTFLDQDSQTVLLAISMSLINGYYFRISTRRLADITGLRRAKVMTAMDNLKSQGYIAVVIPGSGGRGNSPVYMINPACIGTGKMDQDRYALSEYKRFCPQEAMEWFEAVDSYTKWSAAPVTLKVDGVTGLPETIRVNSIVLVETADSYQDIEKPSGVTAPEGSDWNVTDSIDLDIIMPESDSSQVGEISPPPLQGGERTP